MISNRMPGSGGVAGPVDIRGRHALERPVRHFTREVEQCRERNVEGVADQDRLIDAHLSLMGDKPAQNAVWQAAIGMPVVDQGQKSVYADVPVLQDSPYVVHRDAGDRKRRW